MAKKNYRLVLLTVIAIGLGSGAAFAAGTSHSHAEGSSELTLNHGKKWPTDRALRNGMSEIRTLVGNALPKAHAGTLPGSDYDRLAEGILAQIDQITANCKLPEEADAQLHLVLAQIIDGAEHMKGKSSPEGVVKVVGAMGAYGKHFDHPGWKPLKH